MFRPPGYYHDVLKSTSKKTKFPSAINKTYGTVHTSTLVRQKSVLNVLRS